jgi:hypothetical protein
MTSGEHPARAKRETPETVNVHQLPHLTITRYKWWRAGWLCCVTAVATNLAAAGAVALPDYPLNHWTRHAAYAACYLLLAAMMVCMGRAYTHIRPKRGFVTYENGRRIAVRFIPDPDRPRGVFLAVRRSRPRKGAQPVPVTADGIAGVSVDTAQVHHQLRVGDLVIPVRFLLERGQHVDTGSAPS